MCCRQSERLARAADKRAHHASRALSVCDFMLSLIRTETRGDNLPAFFFAVVDELFPSQRQSPGRIAKKKKQPFRYFKGGCLPLHKFNKDLSANQGQIFNGAIT